MGVALLVGVVDAVVVEGVEPHFAVRVDERAENLSGRQEELVGYCGG